jgi:predicted ArsR family transcriptional regulator
VPAVASTEPATPTLTDAKRRLIERLKRVDDSAVAELAEQFDLTDTAVRQHLEALEALGLVERFEPTSRPAVRGRPAGRWRLTALADELFPDRHADLTVELLASIREAIGEDGLAQVLAARGRHQLASYRDALPDPTTSSVRVRVRRLADLRTAEGYLAEARPDGDAGGMLLVEHHCPVCEAATTCQGLCAGELELFRAALGDDVTVERVSHIVSGDARCTYRVTPR